MNNSDLLWTKTLGNGHEAAAEINFLGLTPYLVTIIPVPGAHSIAVFKVPPGTPQHEEALQSLENRVEHLRERGFHVVDGRVEAIK